MAERLLFHAAQIDMIICWQEDVLKYSQRIGIDRLKVGAYFQAGYKGQVRLQHDLILME